MALIDNAQVLNRNVGTNLTPDTVVSGATTVNLNAYTPIDGGSLDLFDFRPGGSIQLIDAKAYTNRIRVSQNGLDAGTDRDTRTAGEDLIDIEDSEITIVKTTSGDTGGEIVERLSGRFRAINSKIVRLGENESAVTTGRFFIGGAAAEDSLNTEIDGLQIIGTDGEITLGLAPVNTSTDVPTLNGLEFIDAAFLEMPIKLPFFGMVASPGASTAQFGSVPAGAGAGNFDGVSWGYSQRFLHFQLPTNNVSAATDIIPPDDAQLMTNYNISNVTAPGSFGGTGAAGSTTNRNSVLQFNRSAATWWINPIFGGNDCNIGFHSGQAPSSTDPSEVRTFIASRPHFNLGDGSAVPTDTKITYDTIVRPFPATWDTENPPAAATDDTITINANDGNGFMVQDARVQFPPEGVATLDQDPGATVNTIAQLTTNRNYFVRNFRYDSEYSVNLGTGDACTALNAITPRITTVTDLNEFLNGRTATTALTSGISNLADVFPSIRRVWFDSALGATIGAHPIAAAGTTFTFDRDLEFGLAGATSISPTLLRIGGNSTGYTLTGDATTFNNGGNDVQWNSVVIPDGITLAGSGTHNGFNPAIGTVTLDGGAYNVGLVSDLTVDWSNVTIPGTININGTGTLNISGLSTEEQGRVDDSGFTGTINFIQDVVNVTVSPGVSEEFLQANGGYWIVHSVGNTTPLEDITITNTTTLADVTFSRADTVSSSFIARYQPLSSLTGGNTYSCGETTFTPDTTGSVVVNPIEDTALTGNTLVDRTSLVSIAVSGAGATRAITVTYDRTVAIDATLAQELALVVRNDKSHIDAIVARQYNLNQPILEFRQPFITAYNGGVDNNPGPRDVYTLLPSDASTGQVALSNTIGYVIGNTATNNVAFFSPDIIQVSATLAQVTAGVEASQRIQDVDNKTSYLVTDGAVSGADVTGSRLVGIRPKNDDYSRTATYTTNT